MQPKPIYALRPHELQTIRQVARVYGKPLEVVYLAFIALIMKGLVEW